MDCDDKFDIAFSDLRVCMLSDGDAGLPILKALSEFFSKTHSRDAASHIKEVRFMLYGE